MNLTQAHNFLIRNGADPDEILDLLDNEPGLDRDLEYEFQSCIWKFSDGSAIQARATGQPNLEFDLFLITP